jgi:hypothetical protein
MSLYIDFRHNSGLISQLINQKELYCHILRQYLLILARLAFRIKILYINLLNLRMCIDVPQCLMFVHK